MLHGCWTWIAYWSSSSLESVTISYFSFKLVFIFRSFLFWNYCCANCFSFGSGFFSYWQVLLRCWFCLFKHLVACDLSGAIWSSLSYKGIWLDWRSEVFLLCLSIFLPTCFCISFMLSISKCFYWLDSLLLFSSTDWVWFELRLMFSLSTFGFIFLSILILLSR